MSRKDDVKRLWRECFGDSDEYTDMFFSRVYSDADTLVETTGTDGRVVSSLQLATYDMLLSGNKVPMIYLGGATTARKYRGRGCMSRLMLRALDEAYSREAVMCALIPAHDWLYFFFERFGFSSVYLADRQCFTSFHPFATEAAYEELSDRYSPEVFEAFERYELNRPGGVLHSRRDFLNILDDLSFRPGGTFVAVSRPEAPVAGMAWAFDRGDFIQVNEILGVDHDARTGALQALRREFPNRQFTVLAPANDHTGRHLYPRGMGRIVNVLRCLEVIAAANPGWRSVIRVTDPLLEQNTGVYLVERGRCGRVNDYAGALDFDIPIDVFTSIVFSSPSVGSIIGFPSERTHISLMLH